jgi:hypothetical protein
VDGVREIEEKNYSFDCVAVDPESSDPAMRLAQLFPRISLQEGV